MLELQKKVAAQAGGPRVVPASCQKPTLDLQATGDGLWLPDQPGWNPNLDSSVMFDNINQMVQMAFICDLTRVVYIGNARCNARLKRLTWPPR